MSSDNECIICAESFLCGDKYLTECNHVYHEHCLAQWLKRSNECPMCRKEINEEDFIYIGFKPFSSRM